MSIQRVSFSENTASARNRLEAIWRQTRQLMSAKVGGSLMDDDTAELHEKISEMKKWADSVFSNSGVYPDAEVLHFVAALKTS